MKSLKVSIFVLSLVIVSSFTHAKKLSVAIFDYPPTFILNNDANPGYCYEIVHKLYSKLGYEVTKVELNFSRAMRSVVAQEIDIICAVNPLNNNDIAVSDQSLINFIFYFWKHKDNPFTYDEVNSLEGQKILNVSGFNYTPTSKAYQDYLERSNNVFSLGGEAPVKRALNMIRLKRADVIALDRDIANFYIKQENLQDTIVVAGRLPNPFPAYVGVSKNHPQKNTLLKQFDNEYQNLLRTGFVDTVLQKYQIITDDASAPLYTATE